MGNSKKAMKPIQKKPNLLPSEDYYFLRQKGMEYIEALGSKLWTDYNIHDPGITILELLCYAITDLGYRTGFDIKDFVADSLQKGGHEQGFFSANEILTVNPVTIADYRKLLIDTNGIRNAWLFCKDCPCEMPLYVDCLAEELVYSETTKKVVPRGTYEILLEFEDSVEYGSLNDGKLFHKYSFFDSSTSFTVTLELRLPNWKTIDNQYIIYKNLLDSPNRKITKVEVLKIVDIDLLDVMNASLQKSLRNPVFVDLKISFDNSESFILYQIPLLIHGKSSAIRAIDLVDLKVEIESQPIYNYQKKILKIKDLIQEVNQKLHQNRNLAEDFCRISEVATEDFAFCADIDLQPDADIEKIEAQILFTIEQYLNPPIHFYSLKQLLDDGIPTEDIFNGPSLTHGFIKDAELEKSILKREIRTSDIINLLMDIEGITGVRNFLITKYNPNGTPALPSQPWIQSVSAQHQPRLYIVKSQFLYFKNDLPFQPANDEEIWATLQQLRSTNEQIKLTILDNDLPMPTGTKRQFDDYYPVQYSFPLTYGIGFDGLPETAAPQRKAQAKQLKAYLMFYEQLLVNYLAQLNNVEQLFSIKESAQINTYFSKLLDNQSITNIEDLYFANYESNLKQITESETLALKRKNIFLDHLLARFGEQFTEYTLLMFSSKNQKFSHRKLINDKIHFLKDYPEISKKRAKAFNYLDNLKVCGLQNVAGLKKRIAHLLGLEVLRNYVSINIAKEKDGYSVGFVLNNGQKDLLISEITDKPKTRLEADKLVRKTIDELVVFITQKSNFKKKTGYFIIENDETPKKTIAKSFEKSPTETFTNSELDTQISEIIDWAKKILSAERFFLVEHILLRPRVYGQSLMPTCVEADCETCGDEDPYSFRLTFVMAGWMPLFQNLDFRRYAERMIRLETPAHILPKICWVGNEVCRGDEDNAILCKIVDTLTANLIDPTTAEARKKEICTCAETILEKYNEAFADLYFQNGFKEITDTEQDTLFVATIEKEKILCNGFLKDSFYTAAKTLIINWFKGKESCFQFNTFNKFWCDWLAINKEWIDKKNIVWIAHLLELTLEEAFKNIIGIVPKSERNKIQLEACQFIAERLGKLGDEIKKWIKANPNQLITSGQIETFINAIFNDFELAIEFDATLSVSIKNTFITNFKTNPIAFSDKTEKLSDRIIRLLKTHYYSADTIKLLTAHDNLLGVFSKLKSIYPPATLHDCEDGNDDNPVRLDQTVLG